MRLLLSTLTLTLALMGCGGGPCGGDSTKQYLTTGVSTEVTHSDNSVELVVSIDIDDGRTSVSKIFPVISLSLFSKAYAACAEPLDWHSNPVQTITVATDSGVDITASFEVSPSSKSVDKVSLMEWNTLATVDHFAFSSIKQPDYRLLLRADNNALNGATSLTLVATTTRGEVFEVIQPLSEE